MPFRFLSVALSISGTTPSVPFTTTHVSFCIKLHSPKISTFISFYSTNTSLAIYLFTIKIVIPISKSHFQSLTYYLNNTPQKTPFFLCSVLSAQGIVSTWTEGVSSCRIPCTLAQKLLKNVRGIHSPLEVSAKSACNALSI